MSQKQQPCQVSAHTHKLAQIHTHETQPHAHPRPSTHTHTCTHVRTQAQAQAFPFITGYKVPPTSELIIKIFLEKKKLGRVFGELGFDGKDDILNTVQVPFAALLVWLLTKKKKDI